MVRSIPKRTVMWIFLIVLMAIWSPRPCAGADDIDLTEMSLEALMDVTVTSVSKKAQHRSDSAAAIHVITHADLRRSGVTNIPDALRMVPGLTVARIDANKWAVNSRGSGSRYSDKLLVLIDGRSVYTPSFSGVYWEIQDVMLEDVQRIEVIRGPGATLWGANAVNGVINIITMPSQDTQGGLVTGGGGGFERAFASARYGAAVGERGHARVYAKGFQRDESEFVDGGDAGDEWGVVQGGFRSDFRWAAADTLTVQGDIYEGEIHQTLVLPSVTLPPQQVVRDEADVAGGNLLARWQRILSSTSDLTLQAYYDRIERKEAIAHQRYDIVDLDLQHRLKVGGRHDLVWGLRYRGSHDRFESTPTVTIDPDSRWDNLFSAFVQDETAVIQDRLWLTLGTKFEHNDYTGVEVQPSARLFWAVDARNKLWTAVSRAVRTPSRIETDGNFATVVYVDANGAFPPVEARIFGNNGFTSEEMIAYEIGYRFLPKPSLSFDLSLFYNDYDRLRTSEPGTPTPEGTYILAPFDFVNGFATQTHGAELDIAWQPLDRVKLDLAYTYLHSDFEEGFQAGVAPRHQLSLRSALDLLENLELDIWLRYVDAATNVRGDDPDFFYGIDDYWTADLRLAWRPVPSVEMSVVGQNLLAPSHMESVEEFYTLPTTVRRSVYGKVTFCF